MIKVAHYTAILLFFSIHTSFCMDTLRDSLGDFKTAVQLATGYNTKSCSKQINDFVKQQALLAGRDPNNTKTIVTKDVTSPYAAMVSGSSDTIIVSEKETKNLEFNFEFIKNNGEECPDHPYLPYAYNYIACAQGLLLHEYGHCVWDKNRLPLQNIVFAGALGIPNLIMQQREKTNGQEFITFLGGIYLGVKMGQYLKMGFGYMSESNADTFSIKKLKQNIVKKNIEVKKAIKILDEMAYFFKAIDDNQRSKSKGIFDRIKYFSNAMLDPHPADYARYVKFQKAANGLRKEYGGQEESIKTEQMLKGSKDVEGTKRIQSLRDNFQVKANLLKYTLPCNRISTLFYYYPTKLPTGTKKYNPHVYPLIAPVHDGCYCKIDGRFLGQNKIRAQTDNKPYVIVHRKEMIKQNADKIIKY